MWKRILKICWRLIALCPLLAVTVSFTISAAGQDFDPEDYRLDAKAFTGASVSNLDLIRKIFPDAQIQKNEPEGATAFKFVPLRHLFGSVKKNRSDESLVLNISQRRETTDGKSKILWLIINAVQPDKSVCEDCFRAIWSEAVLAAYRVSGSNVELIDAAAIATQNITTFDEDRPIVRVAPEREAIVISNSSTSSVGQSEISIVAAGKKGFDVLLDKFVVMTEYRCAEWYSEETSLRMLNASTGGFHDLEIVVKVEGGPGNADYPAVKYRRSFRYVFAWQPRLQKYKALVNPQLARRSFLKLIEPCKNQK